MQNVGGRQRIRERPVRRLVGTAKMADQRLEFAVRDLAGEHPASQPRSVHDPVVQGLVSEPVACGVEEADIEARVVRHQNGVASELQKCRQDRLDRGGIDEHVVGDSGEQPHEGRHGHSRVHQRLKRPLELAHPDLDRPYLGDRVLLGRASGGLEVHDAEGDVGQGRAEVVEAALDAHGGGHRVTISNICSIWQASDSGGRVPL